MLIFIIYAFTLSFTCQLCFCHNRALNKIIEIEYEKRKKRLFAIGS